MEDKKPFGLFERYGIEIEYMICHKETLNVLPIADTLIHELTGGYPNEVCAGKITYSNELASHVIELKVTDPITEIEGMAEDFQEHVGKIQTLLDKHNAVLMPSGMHPWMDPHKELRLWPHGQNEIYDAYNRIFDCTGHGWANLQSTHLNLSFQTDEELMLLHSAIRLLLPLMPALSASSPIKDSSITGFVDTRLETYRHNQKKIPSIAGQIIPEPIRSRDEYYKIVLEPMWKEISPFDPDTILQEEWLNSRGAIVRFDRNAIEIRILDTQESPLMDEAILVGIVRVLQQLVKDIASQKIPYDAVPTNRLKDIFLQVIKDGERVLITDPEYLALFGKKEKASVHSIWKDLLESCRDTISKKVYKRLEKILERGALSKVLARDWNEIGKKEAYRKLCGCLQQGKTYE